MDIKTILHKAVINFYKNNIKFPHLDAEILLSHILKKPREFLLAHPDFEVKKSDVMRYALGVTRRTKGEPIAYITGHKEFYGLDFFVNKNVLIPRPETEMMVDEVLRITRNMERITFIDVGAGSGCIIISLAKKITNSKLQGSYSFASCPIPKTNLEFDLEAEEFKFYGIDISKPALAVARKNAKLHQVEKRIKFLYGDLLEPILKNPNLLRAPITELTAAAESSAERLCRDRIACPMILPAASSGRVLCGETLPGQKSLEIRKYNLVITANLPYLTPQQIKNSPTIQYEPRLALSAGSDGLKYYCRLFKQIRRLRRLLPRFSAGSRSFSLSGRLKPRQPGLKPGRIAPFTILCEIDPSQSAKIKQLVKKELPDACIEIKKDLLGLNRLAVINF